MATGASQCNSGDERFIQYEIQESQWNMIVLYSPLHTSLIPRISYKIEHVSDLTDDSG